MGEYAHLNLSTSSLPSSDATEYLNGSTEVLFKWNAAIAWLALFGPDDFVEQPYFSFSTGSESFPGLYLVSDLHAARKRLETRGATLAQAFGTSWTDNVSEFKAYLENADATHVELDFSELLDDDRSPESTREYYAEILGILDEPLFSGKKSLLSRKPKLTRGWLRIRKEVQGLTTGALSPWNLFGAREDWSWWSNQ